MSDFDKYMLELEKISKNNKLNKPEVKQNHGTDRFIWNRKNQQNTFKTGSTGHARPADTGTLQHH